MSDFIVEAGKTLVWTQHGDRYVVLDVVNDGGPTWHLKLLNARTMTLFERHELYEPVEDIELVEPSDGELVLYTQYMMAPDTVPLKHPH